MKWLFFIVAVCLVVWAVKSSGNQEKPVAFTGRMAPLTEETRSKFPELRRALGKAQVLAFKAIKDLSQAASSAVSDLVKGEDDKEVRKDWTAWAKDNGYGPLFHEVDSMYGDFIREELDGIDTKITWQTVVAKICVESANNPNLVGSAGEIGLMQIKPATGKQFGVSNPEDLYDPFINIQAGIKFLAWLENQLGSEKAAIVGYHYGARGAKDRFETLDKPLHEYVDNLKVAGVRKAAGV
jgi:hypothetical protein